MGGFATGVKNIVTFVVLSQPNYVKEHYILINTYLNNNHSNQIRMSPQILCDEGNTPTYLTNWKYYDRKIFSIFFPFANSSINLSK
jgi:hypothetical protein